MLKTICQPDLFSLNWPIDIFCRLIQKLYNNLNNWIKTSRKTFEVSKLNSSTSNWVFFKITEVKNTQYLVNFFLNCEVYFSINWPCLTSVLWTLNLQKIGQKTFIWKKKKKKLSLFKEVVIFSIFIIKDNFYWYCKILKFSLVVWAFSDNLWAIWCFYLVLSCFDV